MTAPLLEIENLTVEYSRQGRRIPAVRGVSLRIEEGQTLGLVGESGCGKSSLALAILKLILPHEGRVGGSIRLNGRDLLALSDEELRAIRGKDIGIVFQDPFSSLNPVLTLGFQLDEALRAHDSFATPETARQKTLELLKQVRIADAERIYHSYPHQVSGGQRQRVLIAMAIANRPKLLIADEPTTALDVTVQKEILDLLAALQKELKMTILLVSHHLGVIAQYTENLAVFYAGEIVEQGPTAAVIRRPQHPYTQSLLKALPGRGHSGRKLFTIAGAPPDPQKLPQGCAFHPRCPSVQDRCRTGAPKLKELPESGRFASCHFAPFKDGSPL
jgi:oligopeptide/dipeptide ABC transporter ATP-binding protein